ncbi:NAD(P)H-binding protein [Pelagibacterium sp.]|uniref:NmrA family NAD(P)-binding protein n=1 Tax=Pelagibacterium sp. TaxID=1967288 RepID=UPI003A906869
MPSTKTILVVGATGKVGSRVAARLAEHGHAHRAVSRSTTPSFDWENPESWAKALEAVQVAFVSFMPDLAAQGAPEIIEQFIATAKAAGVRKIVLLSARGEHGAELSENKVRQSGLDHVVVRASWFNQNFDEGMFLPSVLSGTLAMAAGDKLEPFVDADDIADVAVASLLDNRHNGEIYEVTGPRLLTFADAASEISAASGLDVAYVPLSVTEFHAALLPVVGQDDANLMANICAELFDGRNERLGDGVQRALGREPRDFGEYLQRAMAGGAWQAAA